MKLERLEKTSGPIKLKLYGSGNKDPIFMKNVVYYIL